MSPLGEDAPEVSQRLRNHAPIQIRDKMTKTSLEVKRHLETTSLRAVPLEMCSEEDEDTQDVPGTDRPMHAPAVAMLI